MRIAKPEKIVYTIRVGRNVFEVIMLVSSIAHMNALRQRNQAQYNIMNTHMAMGSMLRNIHSGAFGGMGNLQALHAMDTQMELSLEQNKLDYLFYSLWEKQLREQQRKEIKEFFGGNKLDVNA